MSSSSDVPGVVGAMPTSSGVYTAGYYFSDTIRDTGDSGYKTSIGVTHIDPTGYKYLKIRGTSINSHSDYGCYFDLYRHHDNMGYIYLGSPIQSSGELMDKDIIEYTFDLTDVTYTMLAVAMYQTSRSSEYLVWHGIRDIWLSNES